MDGKSDQYSLACVVYEMLAGGPPFVANTPQGVIAKRFSERPAPLPSAANVPAAASDVLLRALALDPADRYATVSEFAKALADSIPSAGNAAADSGRRSVAVLPFTNMSADAENEFFTDGITEEIINALTKVRALDVASRTSAFAFKGNKEDIGAIGRKLKVHTVLEGSVRKAGNRLRISTQLVDVATSFQLWSERYDREMQDVFAIQDEIATSIVNALKVVLTPKEEAAIKKIPTQSVRAYEYYLRGRQLFHQRRPETLDAAEDLYRRAIALDPTTRLRTPASPTARASVSSSTPAETKRSRRRNPPAAAPSSWTPSSQKLTHRAGWRSRISDGSMKHRRSSSARWSSTPCFTRRRGITRARFRRRGKWSGRQSSIRRPQSCAWTTIRRWYLPQPVIAASAALTKRTWRPVQASPPRSARSPSMPASHAPSHSAPPNCSSSENR